MKPSAKRVIETYLGACAEVETELLEKCDKCWPGEHPFAHALIIPVYKEGADFFKRLAARQMREESVLLIVVINQPDTLDTPHPQNRHLLEILQSATEHSWRQGNLWLGKLANTDSAVLIVDRFSSRPIPRRQGVGLARKIGADLALALHHRAIIKSPWLYNSDADAVLPGQYFSALDEHHCCAAAIYPYRHSLVQSSLVQSSLAQHSLVQSSLVEDSLVEDNLVEDSQARQHSPADDKLSQVTRLYEQRLAQYVDGLALAGSPYAYHTLGSTIAVHAEAYARVRGFPKRNGGEDFHLLNKLAKAGGITSLDAPLIQIQTRSSDRVPFGTGPAVSQLLKDTDPQQARIFYHPQVFFELKSWLRAMPESRGINLSELPLSKRSITALQDLGTDAAICRARQNSTRSETYIRHLHNWFDALKTLRFIHRLQGQGLGNISFIQLTAQALSAQAIISE